MKLITKLFFISIMFAQMSIQTVTGEELVQFQSDMRDVLEEFCQGVGKNYGYKEKKNPQGSDFVINFHEKNVLLIKLVSYNRRRIIFNDQIALLQFKILEGNPIDKYFYIYKKGEMQLQKEVIFEAILKITSIDFDGNLNMNLIEDINKAIEDKYNNKKSLVQIDTIINTDSMVHDLYMQESLIAKIKISIQEKTELILDDFTNYEMKVIVTSWSEESNKIEDSEILIPVFNDMKFNDYMTKIFELIKIDNYSNNIKDHSKNIQVYLKNFYQHLQFSEQFEDNKLNLIIKYGNEEADFQLQYVQDKEDNLGVFIFEEQAQKIKFEFSRRPVDKLMELFKENKIEKLIEPLYEKIISMIQSNNKNLMNDFPLTQSHEISGYFFNTLSKVEFEFLTNEQYSFSIYHDMDSVELVFVHSFDTLNYMTKKVSIKNYNFENIKIFVQNCLSEVEDFIILNKEIEIKSKVEEEKQLISPVFQEFEQNEQRIL